jgi:hypothetical protein
MTLDLKRRAEEGIEKCRVGNWQAGMDDLGWVAEQDLGDVELPGAFYSYLGYGIAHLDKKYREGLKLCQHAVKMQVYEPDNYMNLARAYLLTRNREKAHKTVMRGLALDADHPGLRRVWRELGLRQDPVISFLARDNPLNLTLGKLRQSFKKKPRSRA